MKSFEREERSEFLPFTSEEFIERIKISEVGFESGNFKSEEEFENRLQIGRKCSLIIFALKTQLVVIG